MLVVASSYKSTYYARVKPDLQNKGRLLPLSLRQNNVSTSLILHLPTEHTCIGVNDGTLLRSEEGFARREPGLWSSCPGSLSMPWPPEGTSSTCASLHWLPTSAFTLPWHVSDVCIQGPTLPTCLLLILTCLDTLGRRPSGRPAGTLSNNNQNGINQTNRKQPLRTVNSYTTLPKNTCSSVVGKTNLSHDKQTIQ